jgi:glutamate synthase (NADPH/NADH) small chain
LNSHCPYINLKNKIAVVLGGGDTAMDCVRTAIRQGASKVMCVYRKDQMAMPGSRKEFHHALEEGVEFIWYHQAESVERSSDGQLVGIHCKQTHTESSRFIECDAVIVAYGFRASPPQSIHDLELDAYDRVKTSEAEGYRTSVNKLYAGGDMVRGADLVVTAIAEGRKAAESICCDLGVII